MHKRLEGILAVRSVVVVLNSLRPDTPEALCKCLSADRRHNYSASAAQAERDGYDLCDMNTLPHRPRVLVKAYVDLTLAKVGVSCDTLQLDCTVVSTGSKVKFVNDKLYVWR